jgi:hypothetical protein
MYIFRIQYQKIKSKNQAVCCGCVVSENYFPPARIENTRYSSHNENMAHHSTIHPASYKGYGCNNAKPARPPHCNTIIDIVVLGCGPIPMDNGAMALFIGVHIIGEIRPAGGFDTLAESQRKDQIGPSIPVRKINHTTITVRGLFMFGESAVGQNGGPVCGDGN